MDYRVEDLIISDIKEIKEHIKILNREHGETRDIQKTMNSCVADIKKDMSQLKQDNIAVKTDLVWIKKFFWLVAGTSVGAAITGTINLFTK